MGGRAGGSGEDEDVWAPPPISGPPLASAVALALLLLIALVSNGRPIGAGDTRVNEHVAASLVQEHNFDLDEYPALEPPFVRQEGPHRVSIYPVLGPVLAAPLFAGARLLFALDENGTALAGKCAASLFSAVAAALLFLAVGRRRADTTAAWTAAVFALGTSVWSTSQALWQHPPAVMFLCLALLWISKAEDDPAWAGRAGLPLCLAVAARHADVALVAVLGLAVAVRWPRRIPFLLLWAVPGVAFVTVYQWASYGSATSNAFTDSGLERFAGGLGVGHLGLLVSPAKGLLVYTPVVLFAALGLFEAFRGGERWLSLACGAAILAHWGMMGCWSEWHGGESWGPRLMTDALPLLFLFLPDGFDRLPSLGMLLAALSIGVQLVGAFSYNNRWERLHRPLAPGAPELWSVSDNPLALHLRERVAILAVPDVRGGHVVIREEPFVLFGPKGSRVHFAADALQVSGTDVTLGDVHLQQAARVDGDKLRLKGRWDGLFLRVTPEGRTRPLQLRISGRGRGVLYVGERSFWAETPRWSTYTMDGAVRIRHPYDYPESGGGELVITIGKSPGEAALDLITLVPPGEPDKVFETPGAGSP
jgi:hypothetical protein